MISNETISENALRSALRVPFIFRDRDVPVPPELRPEWRIASLVLCLRLCCKDYSSKLVRLHLLNWAMRTEESRLRLRRALEGEFRPDILVGRFDPSLDRAISYATAEKFVTIASGKRVVLEEKGKRLADEILADPAMMKEERAFLHEIGLRISDSYAARLMKGEFKSD